MLANEFSNKKVIIIGGGAAGIACAKELEGMKFKNITVLEASSRLGGRVHTISSGDNNYIDLGMQRVTEDSILYRIADDTRQIDRTAPNYTDALENFELVYGKKDCEAISALRRFLSHRLIIPKDMNVILNDKEFLKLLDGENLIGNYMEGVYRWYFGMSYEYMFSKNQAELITGFGGILNTIVKSMNMDIFIQEKEVIKIDCSDFQNFQSRFKKIKVLCQDGSLYEADHVIISIPLGYLKEHVNSLFVPPLPEKKRKAIQALPFTTVNKIFLEFENPFWDKSDIYHVIWNASLDEYFDCHKKENPQHPKDWIKFIGRFEYVHSNPNALCAWIWDLGATIMENLSEEIVSCCCMKLLEYLTKKSLPKPIKMTRSMWNSNHLFRGSVIYDPSQGGASRMSKLAEIIYDPLHMQPLLFFAGDATCRNTEPSGIPGAVLSGIRAANQLFQHYAHDCVIID